MDFRRVVPSDSDNSHDDEDDDDDHDDSDDHDSGLNQRAQQRPKPKPKAQARHKAVRLPRRSLLVLEGEARLAWMHGIGSRKNEKLGGVVVERQRRVSLSFRRVREPRGCVCAYPGACDWQQGQGQGQGQRKGEGDRGR
jgi:hypothetical protein